MESSYWNNYIHVFQNQNRILYTNPVCLLTTTELIKEETIKENDSKCFSNKSLINSNESIINTNESIINTNESLINTNESLINTNESIINSNQNNIYHYDNVMTITWLTPINTGNQFIMSINKKRFSSKRLKESSLFGLQVPTLSWKNKILAIGSVTGEHFNAGGNVPFDEAQIDSMGIVKSTRSQHLSHSNEDVIESNENLIEDDKNLIEGNESKISKSTNDLKWFTKHNLLTMGFEGIISQFGKKKLKHKDHIIYKLYTSKMDMLKLSMIYLDYSQLSKKRYKKLNTTHLSPSFVPFLKGCSAYLMCNIIHVDSQSDSNHFIIRSEILDAFVESKLWKNGKLFIPNANDPYLTFFGTQEFGVVTSFDLSLEENYPLNDQEDEK